MGVDDIQISWPSACWVLFLMMMLLSFPPTVVSQLFSTITPSWPRAFRNIARRIEGEDVPLMNLEEKQGFFGWLKHMLKAD